MNSFLHMDLQWSKRQFPKISMAAITALLMIFGYFGSAQTTTRFNDGYLTVLKVTSGATLGNTGTALVAEEFLPTGAAQANPNYSFSVPVSGATRAVISGSATSSGAMTRSENGRYLLIPGYDAAVGDANSTFTTSALRLLNGGGIINAGIQGIFYTATNDFRGAVTDDGSNFWASGGSTGIRYSSNGTTVTTISTTSTNTRVVNIFNGQLFYSTGSGTNGVYQVGNGKPTATGTTSVLQAPATAPYSFSVSPDGLTIYSFSSANTIARFTYSGTYNAATFTYSGGTWSAASTGFTLTGATGVAVDWSGYAFSTGTNGAKVFACNPTTLVTGTDNGTGAITTTTLRTSTGNNAFRGLAFSPVKQTVSRGASSPVAGNITQGSNNTVLFQLAISADEGNSTFRKITLAQTGTASLGTGNSLDNFRLIYDADGNGLASAGEISASLATGTIAGSNITFSVASPAYINQGSTNNYLVIANVSGSATGTFIPSIATTKTLNSINYTTNVANAGGSLVTIGATAPTGNTLTISAATVATIGTTGTLTAVNTTYGTASANTTFTASGVNLTNNILITAPAGFEISQTAGGTTGFATTQTLVQTGGTVNATTIYVRLAATTTFGSYSGNITLTSSPATPATVATVSSSVAKKALTVTGATANNKIYDRTTAATISGATASGTVNGDAITISGGGTFASFTVGNGIAVTPALTFSGTNSGSYTLTQPTGLSANITPKDLTISGASASNKVYDGNTDATLSGTLSGVIAPDDVTLNLSASFDSPSVGTAIPVASASTLSGGDASNYNLVQPTGITANISPKALTIAGAAAQNKVYDGNTDAVITGTLVGVIAPDDVTLVGTGTFASPNVGTNIAVTSTSTIVGDISNYTLTQPTGLTANISSAPLTPQTITFNPLADVTYGDASFSLTATASSGLPVSYSSSDTSVATISGSTVTIVGVGITTITASQQGDLTYDAATPVDQPLNVLQKALTISSPSAANKVYDGTTPTTVSGTLSGIVGSDNVTLNGTGNFATEDAGTGIAVTSDSTLTGADAGKYTLTQPAGLTADITPKALTVSNAVASNKVYDGTTAAAITGGSLVGVVGIDSVTIAGGGIFATKNVGTGIGVTAALTLSGTDASNYSVTQPTGLTANITTAALTISGITGANRVYNGLLTASLNGTPVLNGVFGSDNVSVSGTPTAAFATKTVGTAKPITVTGYTLTGTDAANYTVSQPTGITANITAAPLTISGAVAQNKTFDGTTAATITGTLSGIIAPDVVTLNGTGTFASSSVGNNIAVTSTSTLSGADSANYVINPQPAGLTANIIAAPTAFTAGNLVVARLGATGQSSAPTSAGTAIFLNEYSTTGSPGYSVSLPTTTAGSINRLVGSGSATSEDQLNLSTNGQYLVIGGYDAPIGQASVNSATGLSRVIARVDNGGTIATSLMTSTTHNSGFRSVASIDGSRYWTAGNGTGVASITHQGNTTAVAPTVISSTPTNLRDVAIYNGQLYFSTGSGSIGIYKVGTGIPTTSGQTSTNNVPASGDPYAYYMVNRGSTNWNCYVAYATAPGVYKFSSTDNGATWTARGSVTTAAIYGLVAKINGSNVDVYATTTGSIIKVTDTAAFNANITGTSSTIATAPANTNFRGLSFAPGLPPTASVIAGTATICTGSSANITVSITGGTSPYTVVYSNGTSNITVNSYISGTAIPVSPTSNTTYTLVSVTDASGLVGSGNSGSAVITVNQQYPFYADADGDTYGAGSTVNVCAANATTPPAGYSVNGTDCNDADATVHQTYPFYADADGDTYGTGSIVNVCAANGTTAPAGYSLNNTDCNDANAAVYQSASLYIDADADGYDAGTSVQCYGATVPTGYSATTLGSDCNDADATVHQTYPFYADADGDTYGTGSIVNVCAANGTTAPAGYSLNNTDCNDANAAVYQSASLYIDADADGYDAGTSVQCYGATVPTGYSATTLGSDCNDADATVHQTYPFYADADGDTYGTGSIVNVCAANGTTAPAGYSLNNTDCNDSNAAQHQTYPFYADADGDTYGAGSLVIVCAANGTTPPAGYSLNNTDCNDANASVYQNGQFYVDADNDGYNNGGSAVTVCYGATAPSGYTLNTGVDCNDNVAAINPGHAEVLYNGIDDNCNGQLDEGNQIKTKLLPESCGVTLAAINSLIGITTVSSQITGYRIRVTNGAQVQIIDKNVPHFTLTELPSYAYATTYTVDIQLQRLGVWLGYYGDTCLVSSPAVLSSGGATQVSPSQCGSTLPRINTLIATTSLQGVTGYRFRVTNLTTTTGPNVIQVIDRTTNYFQLQMLTQYNYGTTYQVEVAIRTTGGFGGYGGACNITSPSSPSLDNCGGTVAASTTRVSTASLSGVTQYRFQIQRDSDGATTTIDRGTNYFTFAQIPGYTPSALYNIRVAVMTTGTWSPFGDICQITSPPSVARHIAESANEESLVAAVVKAYPNPFSDVFTLDMSGLEKVSVRIYDVSGRLLETLTDANGPMQIGNRYPSGTYTVIVDNANKQPTILRMVKR